MFRNINSDSLLIKDHLHKSQAAAVNQSQASVILQDIFKDQGNPQSQAQYYKNQTASSGPTPSKKKLAKDSPEKQDKAPPKNFLELLNII